MHDVYMAWVCLVLHHLAPQGSARVKFLRCCLHLRICNLYRLVCYHISLRVGLHSQNTCLSRTITRIKAYFSIETYKSAIFRFNPLTGNGPRSLKVQLQKKVFYNDVVPLLGGVRGIWYSMVVDGWEIEFSHPYDCLERKPMRLSFPSRPTRDRFGARFAITPTWCGR